MRLPLAIITLLTLFLTPVIQVASVEEEYDEVIQGNREDLPENEDLPQYEGNEESEYPEVFPSPNIGYDGDGPNGEEEEAFPEETSEKVEEKEETESKPEFDGVVIKESANGGLNDCGPPPTIERAKISSKRVSKYSVGDKVSYVCQFGYVSDGPLRFSHCVRSEETQALLWTNPEINCVPRSCGDPGSVHNGYMVGSIFTFPNFVSFECDEGYELRGRGVRYCQTSGTWSGTLPTCEKIFCDPPSQPENGRVSFSSLEYGSVLKYECTAGFILREHYPRVCSENGTWSGNDPICTEAKCDYPETPEHGTVQLAGGEPSVDSLALYTCEKGRILVGSATSRCLDEGIWTFPTPKCAEPCAVPELHHGEIGKYVRDYRYRKRLEKIPAGTAVRDGEELYITCHENYEPLGKANHEEKISCSGGQWLTEPQCLPAACRGVPPFTANVRDLKINRQHRGNVVYYCNIYSKKVASGNVTCHFGKWRGRTPICKDKRCNIESLQFSGMVRGKKQFYGNNEGFDPTCDNKHSPAKQNNAIICQNGEWKGHFPPCIPAPCVEEPPSIDHGRTRSVPSTLHSTIVSYECDEFYQLKEGKVQCQFGEWAGSLPECLDSRCYSKDLKKFPGVAYGMRNVTLSDEYSEVKCSQGFYQSSSKPLCQNGKWIVTKPPCLEHGCSINAIINGQMTKLVEKTNFWGTRWMEYDKAAIGERKSPRSIQYVSCNNGYSFQGKGSNDVSVTCTEGNWKPRPVCLVDGQPYEEEERATTRPTQDGVEESLKEIAEDQRPTSLSINESTDPEAQIDTQLKSVTSEDSCTCKYRNLDTKLIAYAGTELLQYGTRVKNNCKVRFQCEDFGYYRLQGSEEITCRGCQDWHSSEFPNCLMPERGDTIISVNGKWERLPGGYIGIRKGETVSFDCFPNGVSSRPKWKSNVRFNYATDDQKTTLIIRDASVANNGKYECMVKEYRSKAINIQVIESVTNCPKFEEGNVFNIYYDNEQEVNSTAIFSCKRENEKITGGSTITCLSNGRWSGGQPQCKKQCPKLTEAGGMSITYTSDLNVGSTASFHCFLPHVLSGVSSATCKFNGKWSNTLPSCSLPTCSLPDFFDYVPEDVVPDMSRVNNDTLPYNFTLHLTCDGNKMLLGSNTARCGQGGTWEVSKVECVPGCVPLTVSDSSSPIVDPEKEFYRFGDIVTLSCPPEQELDSEVVRIMCLLGGWSEAKIPNCLDKVMTDDATYDDSTES